MRNRCLGYQNAGGWVSRPSRPSDNSLKSALGRGKLAIFRWLLANLCKTCQHINPTDRWSKVDCQQSGCQNCLGKALRLTSSSSCLIQTQQLTSKISLQHDHGGGRSPQQNSTLVALPQRDMNPNHSAHLSLSKIFGLHGIPRSIMSNQDKLFTS